MTDNKNKSLHIAMYPWFAISHITSFLHLANKLAKRGHKVSFFLPPNFQSKLAYNNDHPTLISFIPISIPSVDGLPPGGETTNDVPRSAWTFLMTAMDLTRDVIRAHLVCLKPDIVLFDFTHWLPEIARELGIKPVMYSIINMASVAYILPKIRDLPKGDEFILKETDLLEPSPGYPSQAIRIVGLYRIKDYLNVRKRTDLYACLLPTLITDARTRLSPGGY